MKKVLRRLFGWWLADDELREEIESHIQMRAELNRKAGMADELAGQSARRQFGNTGHVYEETRRMHVSTWIETILQDIRHALRSFRRTPAFTLAAVFAIALGIGATSAVFSVVDRILFRSLPYAHPNQLVSVGLTAPIIPHEFMLGGSYYVWRDNQKPFSALTSETGVNACDLTEHNPAHLSCASVEANFLPTLGVSPFLGRNFLPEEDRPNGPKVALISSLNNTANVFPSLESTGK